MNTKQFYKTLSAEFLKLKGVKIVWVTFVAFAIAPVMGGVFIWILTDPEAMVQADALVIKAQMLDFKSDWASYLKLLTQAMGVGGILIFGFTASWIFGREYADGTAKDLLALPVSRKQILNAKFVVYLIWGLALAISNLLVGLLIGGIIGVDGGSSPNEIFHLLVDYMTTTFLILMLGTPVALLSLYGKDYLAPMGLVAIALVFSQIIAAAGYGAWFPWSIPALLSGLGESSENYSGFANYAIVILTGIAGYLSCLIYWDRADQI